MKGKKREFIWLTALLCLTRICDVVMTYLVTPDLTRETNPLVSVFGQGWILVIAVQVILVTAVVLLNYFGIFKVKPAHPLTKGLSFGEFATEYYLGRKQHWTSLLYRFPNRLGVFVRAFGYTLPRALILIGLLVSASSAMLVLSETYDGAYPTIRPLLYVMLVAVALYFYYRFFTVEYRAYRESRELAERG